MLLDSSSILVSDILALFDLDSTLLDREKAFAL